MSQVLSNVGSNPPIEGEDEGANDEGTDLQFDHAEPTTPVSPGPSCDACKRPIRDAYYEINGKVLCTSCRHRIEASLRGGSGLARFIRAVVLGTGAAIAEALLTSSAPMPAWHRLEYRTRRNCRGHHGRHGGT